MPGLVKMGVQAADLDDGEWSQLIGFVRSASWNLIFPGGQAPIVARFVGLAAVAAAWGAGVWAWPSGRKDRWALVTMAKVTCRYQAVCLRTWL